MWTGVALRVLAQGMMAPSAARRGKAPARAFGVGPEAQDGRRGYGRGHPLRVRAVKGPAADAAGRWLHRIGARSWVTDGFWSGLEPGGLAISG